MSSYIIIDNISSVPAITSSYYDMFHCIAVGQPSTWPANVVLKGGEEKLEDCLFRVNKKLPGLVLIIAL